jgi:hypothetical protein
MAQRDGLHCAQLPVAEAAADKRVTRDVDPSALRDLIDDPPRATVAFIEREAAELLPVKVVARRGLHLFGIVAVGSPDIEGREVVLLMDGGSYWFELRGVSVRGSAARVDSPEGEAAERLRWYAVVPRRVLAWDYGSIRET